MAFWKFNSTITAEGLTLIKADGTEDELLDYIANKANVFTVKSFVVDGEEYTNKDFVPMCSEDAGGGENLVGVLIYNDNDSVMVYMGNEDGSLSGPNHLTNQTLEITSIGENVRSWLEANAKLITTTITYGDITITIPEGKQATLECTNKLMENDIVVTNPVKPTGEGGSNTFTFKIGDTEYTAEAGMSWEQWVNSEYNTVNASLSGSAVNYYSDNITYSLGYNTNNSGYYVRTWDGISSTTPYIGIHTGGGSH